MIGKHSRLVDVRHNMSTVHLPASLYGLSWPVAVALEGCAFVYVAWAAPRGRAGAATAAAVSFAAFLLPIVVAAEPRVARAAVAFLGVLCGMRLVDLLRGARFDSFARRLWFVFTLFDIRETARGRPIVDCRRILETAAYALVAAMSVLLLRSLPFTASPTPLLLVRWLFGALLCYTAAETVVGIMRTAYRLAGIVTPEIHSAPILSRSIGEFWGQRWNLPVHDWLLRHCFKPAARRSSPMLGVAAAFATSMLIHVWTVFFGVGVMMALLVAAFFLVQGLLVITERALSVMSWSDIAARSWTTAGILGTSPLFVEPFLRLVGL